VKSKYLRGSGNMMLLTARTVTSPTSTYQVTPRKYASGKNVSNLKISYFNPRIYIKCVQGIYPGRRRNTILFLVRFPGKNPTR
jgi:hypothetical protein